MSEDTANSLLTEMLAAHGGLERWRALKGMSSTIVTGGSLWGLKGIDLPPVPRTAITDFHRQWSSVSPFGDPDWTMTWTPSHVVIKSSAEDVIAERDNPRDAFLNHGYETAWDPLHLAYFNGYAMWTYHAVPFVLAEPGYRVNDVPPVSHKGETLRGLRVRFPDGIHTHTQEQRFYFGADGLLRRHDYEVDVWANTPAAHFVSDYVEVGGLRLPTRRRVHPRALDGAPQYDVDIVSVDMSNYVLRSKEPDGLTDESATLAARDSVRFSK